MPLPEEGERFENGNFLSLTGGVNNRLPDEHIAENELSSAENVIPDKLSVAGEGVIKREGVTKYLATQQTQIFRSIYQGYHQIYFTGTTLCKTSANTTIFTGTGASNNWDWTTWSDTSVTRDLFVNAFDAPQKTDGTAVGTAVIAGSPPVSRLIKVFNNMVFIVPSGGTSNSRILRWSDVGTFETWPAVNAFTIGRLDNIIVGIMPFHDVLWVGLERGFLHVNGFHHLDMAVTYKSYEEGLASHRSIVMTPYGLFWWGRRGAGLIWSKTGFGGSDLDRPLMRKIPRTLSTIAGNLGFVHGIWNAKHERVEMYVPTTSSNVCDLTIYYYPETDTVWPQTGAAGIGMSASAWIVTSVGGSSLTGAPLAVVGSDSTSGYFYSQSGATDDGTAIASFIETRRDSTEYGPAAVKFMETVTPIYLNEGSGSMTYAYYLDDKTSTQSATNTLSTAGALDAVSSKTVGLGKSFRKIKHRISDSASVRTRIRGIVVQGYLVSA